MARPARPEQSKSARSSRQFSRFYHSINPDRVFGTHTVTWRFVEQRGEVTPLVGLVSIHPKRRASKGGVVAYPDTAMHVVLDNLNTPTPANDRWLTSSEPAFSTSRRRGSPGSTR